jgi:hypothetical protein
MDHDSLATAVVAALRSDGFDLLLTRDAGLERVADYVLLNFATEHGRAVFTANVADFGRLHGELLASGQHHAGIIVRAEQTMPIGAQLRAFRRIAELFSQAGLADDMLYLDNYR